MFYQALQTLCYMWKVYIPQNTTEKKQWFLRIYSFLSWKDSSFDKVLVLQMWRPTFSLLQTYKNNGHGYMYVIPLLGRERQEDPWVSLASQSNQIGELQANRRPCLKRGRWHSRTWHLRIGSILLMHMCTCTHPPHIIMYTHSCMHMKVLDLLELVKLKWKTKCELVTWIQWTSRADGWKRVCWNCQWAGLCPRGDDRAYHVEVAVRIP